MNEAELHAYVDGRLDAERRAAVDSWLAAHPDDQERVAAYQQLRDGMRAAYDPVLDEAVPAHMHSRARRRWRPYAVAAAWITLGVAIGMIAGWWLHDSRPALPVAVDAGAAMARRAAVAHATYSPEVRHPVEVGADDEPHLTAWLSKRLGAPVRPPKLEAVGYKLIGGRLLPGESGPVAHFMYQCQAGTRVTLYVRSDDKSTRETALRFSREGNVRVFYWVDRKMGYALSSADISKETLNKVADAAYQQLNP
jgi:anti-sigma factor RsiW